MSNYPAGVTDSHIDALFGPDPITGMGEMSCDSGRDECMDPETTECWYGQVEISEWREGHTYFREWTCPRCGAVDLHEEQEDPRYY